MKHKLNAMLLSNFFPETYPEKKRSLHASYGMLCFKDPIVPFPS